MIRTSVSGIMKYCVFDSIIYARERSIQLRDCSLAGLNEECKMQIFSEYIEFGILIASIQKIKVRQKSTLFFFFGHIKKKVL